LENDVAGEEGQVEENWAAGRKKRKAKGKDFPSVKVRRQSSSTAEKSGNKETTSDSQKEEREAQKKEKSPEVASKSSAEKKQDGPKSASPESSTPKVAAGGLLGLGDYSSDDD
jgi:hypothetical protein